MGWRRHTTPSMGRDRRIALVLEFLSHEKVERGFVRQPHAKARAQEQLSPAVLRKGQGAALPPGLQRFRFHDPRHTAGSLAGSLGVQPKVIQARLGHASITTTMDRYGHVYPADDVAAAQALDSAFGGAAQR